MFLVRTLCVVGALMNVSLAAVPQTGNDSQNDASDVNERGSKPLLKWSFEKDELGTWSSSKPSFGDGPRPPHYPGFKADNRAAMFAQAGTSSVVNDSNEAAKNLKFGLGDGITLEAWVNVTEMRDGEYRYLIGKGRHRHSKFATENQNYALRLKGEGGEARPSFLFRSQLKDGEKFDSNQHYHRWTASQGFSFSSSTTENSSKRGWHHIAVSFKFGDGDSIKGFVDGKEVKGVWDLGGKTDRAPIQDADDVVIGTGNGGGAGNSFHGLLDEVAIYRDVVPAAELVAKFQYVAPPPAPPAITKSELVPGKVLVQICEEGLGDKNAWPSDPLSATESFTLDAFGIVEVPHKYVDSGVRGDRPNPYLLRAASLVNLPAGKHRLLLRSRGAAHLLINGQKVLSISFPKGDAGGHGHVAEQEGFLNLGPDFRFAPPGTQENWCDFESKGGEHFLIVEQIVGGVISGKSRRRPETGEFVVAWSRAGSTQWEIVSPTERVFAYHDAGWANYEAVVRTQLAELNSNRRAALRATHAEYWSRRRKAAADWLASTKNEPVPTVTGTPAESSNPIDRFVNAKFAEVSAQAKSSKAGSVDYFRDIQPILEAKCYDCHRGGKAKGDLRLDARADAEHVLAAGKPDESELLKRVTTTDSDLIMPPKGDPLMAEQVGLIKKWIEQGAAWPEFKTDGIRVLPQTDDLSFIRRVYLDTVGVVPTLEELQRSGFAPAAIAARLGNRASSPTQQASKDGVSTRTENTRSEIIDRLLADPRWADHWMGYWQDVLAENPNMLNPTLNNSGPFRWWLYESLIDNKPMDLLVTELLRMRGSERFGGPAGFAIASQNDVPMAQKGTIVSAAFLGVEMKCARCHDAPAHVSLQRDLFELAAMLGKQSLTVPASSSVSAEKLTAGGRKPLISVTLKTGTSVAPRWPFERFVPESVAASLVQDANDPRDRLAALMTAPQNERFAQVMANRVWKRLMGRGIVEPVDDWEKGRAAHPELLRWLGREFVRSGYDMKHLARLILTSQAYQRATDTSLKETSPLFVSPAPRRLDAEQIVDSVFVATGKPFRVEEVSLDIDGRRDLGNSISLGQARRSWMLTTSSNERDRPSLNLPRMQAVTDVLSAFGWRGARQDPTSVREISPNALQPAILSNGTMSVWLTRLSDDHGLTEMALEDRSPTDFVEALFLRLLTRMPTADERIRYVDYLTPGFDSRVIAATKLSASASQKERRPAKYVSWSNHLDPEATLVRQQQEVAARQGDAPTERLEPVWRERFENVLWALLNSPEWVYSP